MAQCRNRIESWRDGTAYRSLRRRPFTAYGVALIDRGNQSEPSEPVGGTDVDSAESA